jgi:hypothetical protein
MNRHAVMLPPPKEPPAPHEPDPDAAREALLLLDLRKLPDAVALELVGLLEFRCRKTPGECFCGEHKL